MWDDEFQTMDEMLDESDEEPNPRPEVGRWIYFGNL